MMAIKLYINAIQSLFVDIIHSESRIHDKINIFRNSIRFKNFFCFYPNFQFHDVVSQIISYLVLKFLRT